MRTWPRFTAYQIDLITRMARDRYGDFHEVPRARAAFFKLRHEGMVEQGWGGWWSITQRGRDYVRFGLPKKRLSREEKDAGHS